MNLVHLPCLTKQECQTAVEDLTRLKQHWIRLREDAPYFSFGKGNYNYIGVNMEEYYSIANRFNPVLKTELGWMYEKVVEQMSDHLGARVVLKNNASYPGFHICLNDPVFEKYSKNYHVDLHFRKLQWSREPELTEILSFTLPIALPSLGGGMNVKEIRIQETYGLSEEAAARLIDSTNHEFYPYRLGQLAVHDGLTYHQIAPFKKTMPGDQRITLQGHAVLDRKRWELFW